MATANALLTVDEFLKLPEHEGERVELVQGEVVTVAAAGFPHERLKARVTRLLNVWLAQNPLGEVFSETMYLIVERHHQGEGLLIAGYGLLGWEVGYVVVVGAT